MFIQVLQNNAVAGKNVLPALQAWPKGPCVLLDHVPRVGEWCLGSQPCCSCLSPQGLFFLFLIFLFRCSPVPSEDGKQQRLGKEAGDLGSFRLGGSMSSSALTPQPQPCPTASSGHSSAVCSPAHVLGSLEKHSQTGTVPLLQVIGPRHSYAPGAQHLAGLNSHSGREFFFSWKTLQGLLVECSMCSLSEICVLPL